MQRGFTLVEMAVAVGIVATLLLAAGAISLGRRPLTMSSAATQFEAQVQAARSLAAASGNGATIVIQPRTLAGLRTGGGFKSLVYAGRPSSPGALAVSSVPVVASDADISEANVGMPPFAIFISASGHVSMAGSYPSPSEFDSSRVTPIGIEPACAPAGNYTLTFSANGASRTLVLPCQVSSSGTPLPLVTNTPVPFSSAGPTPTPSPTPTVTPLPLPTPLVTPTPTPTPTATPCSVNCTTPTPSPTPSPTPCASSCGRTLLSTSGRWAMPVGGCNPRTGTCQVNKITRTITLSVPVAPSSAPVHIFFSFTDSSTAGSFFPMSNSILDPAGNPATLSGSAFWQGDLSTGLAGTYTFRVQQGCQSNGNAAGTQNCSLGWTFEATQ